MENFDLTVLGGGPAGYNAAAYAASKGLSVVLFEKNELGGVCLNEGCVPSKTLLNSAKVLNYFKHGENYGVKFSGDGEVSQEAVVDRKNKVVKRLVTGVRAKLKGAGVTVVKAEAKILCRDENGVVVQSENVEYNSKFLLIATGSSAFIPKIPGVDKAIESGLAITNREALNLVEIPKTLLIMGGGVIGLEMADYYSSVGSDVVVVEMLGKIAGAIIVVARIFDALNDPIMGGIVENTRTKWGKYKPWQLIGCVLTAGVIIALFNIPADGWGFIALIAVMYFLFSITFTMNDISYWGMMPTLTSDPHDRDKLMSFTQIIVGIAAPCVYLSLTVTCNCTINGQGKVHARGGYARIDVTTEE